MHTHQFIEKLPQAKMPPLIINCEEIKSDVSKRKKNPLGRRILYFIMLVWRGAAVIHQREEAWLMLASLVPLSGLLD